MFACCGTPQTRKPKTAADHTISGTKVRAQQSATDHEAAELLRSSMAGEEPAPEPEAAAKPKPRQLTKNTSKALILDKLHFDETFAWADANNDGDLGVGEVRLLCEKLFRHWDPDFVLTEDDHKTLFQLFDYDKSGDVSKDEFKRAFEEWFTTDTTTKRRKALIVVDVQNDFLTGSLKVEGGVGIVAGINALRERVEFDLVAHTQDFHPADHVSFEDNHPGADMFSVIKIPAPDGTEMDQVMWPRHCVQGSHGTEFHEDLVVLATDHVVQKGKNPKIDSYSGFYDNFRGGDGTASSSYETEMRQLLLTNRINEVYVVGVATDFCVGSTAFDAAQCGFTTYLLDDLAKGVNADSIAEMHEKLRGENVGIVQSAQVPLTRSNFVLNPELAMEVARKLVGGAADGETISLLTSTQSVAGYRASFHSSTP